MKTYTLKAESYGYNFHVEVSADELRRVLIQEGAGLSAGLIRSLFDMSFESIFALRREYDLRGGPAAITPEAVARTFGPRPWSTFGPRPWSTCAAAPVEHVAAHVLRPPQQAAIATVHGGQPGTTYEVDLDRRTVTVVGMTVSADELRVHIGAADTKPSAGAKLERRCAAAPRRRPWDGVNVYPWRRSKKGGRRAGDHLQRRQPGAAPRRQRVENRRTFDGLPVSWRHLCSAQLSAAVILRSNYCPDCAMPRAFAIERRRVHRRNPFSGGRRREDA